MLKNVLTRCEFMSTETMNMHAIFIIVWWMSSWRSEVQSQAELDFTIIPYETTPGVYFKNEGRAQLSTLTVKVVTYINITRLEDVFAVIRRNVQQTQIICNKLETKLNFTCQKDISMADSKVATIRKLKEMINKSIRQGNSQTGQESNRKRRGAIDGVGTIAKWLFGTLDNNDAKYYEKKISKLESEQMSMLKITKEQIVVVKSTLQSVNQTLYDVADNERKLTENLDKIRVYLKDETVKWTEALSNTELEVTINRHLIEVMAMLGTLQEQYNVVLNAIMHAQSGIVQVQILGPDDMARALKELQNSIPSGFALPFNRKSNIVASISKISILLKNGILTYILEVPLSDQKTYDVFKAIPFPTKISDHPNHYVYIDFKESYIFIDSSRQSFVWYSEKQLDECKRASSADRICTATNPIAVLHGDHSCPIDLMNGALGVPKSCETKIVPIVNLLWIPVNPNLYLYVAPRSTKVTIICTEITSNKDLMGTGMIKFFERCTLYAPMSKLMSNHIISNNQSKDFVPQYVWEMDICEELNSNINIQDVPELSDINLGIVSHAQDFKYAGKRTVEVERIIKEFEEDMRNKSLSHQTAWYMYILYIVMAIIVLTCCIKCCKCCRCKRWKNYWDDGSNCCTKICFKQNIINQSGIDKNSDENITVHFERGVSREDCVITANPRKAIAMGSSEQSKLLTRNSGRTSQQNSPSLEDRGKLAQE